MLGLDSSDRLLCGLPLFHVNGVIVTGLAPFMAGARVVLLGADGYRSKATIRDFWRNVERFRASFFSAVPTLYSALLGMPIDGADVSSLRHAICGAAPMPPELIRRFEDATGVKILEGYGLTEGTCVSAVNPRDGRRAAGSIGLRIPYQQMKTVALDAEGRAPRDCVDDEIGHLVIKGPNVFPGYKDEQANRGIWIDDGWLDTGDLARRDGDGRFWLTGRQKDLIIRGGHNIDPAVIEEALMRHPAVQMAAAIGRPDAYAGELPMAYVTLRSGPQRQHRRAARVRKGDDSRTRRGAERSGGVRFAPRDRRRQDLQARASLRRLPARPRRRAGRHRRRGVRSHGRRRPAPRHACHRQRHAAARRQARARSGRPRSARPLRHPP